MENKEIWKPIIINKQKTNYKVSNLGRVKRIAYIRIDSLNRKYQMAEKILKPTDNGDGYLTVRIIINHRKKHFRINRLVANAFIPNDSKFEKNEVDHIDENRYNNNVFNLRWISHQANIKKRDKKKSHLKPQKNKCQCCGQNISSSAKLCRKCYKKQMQTQTLKKFKR